MPTTWPEAVDFIRLQIQELLSTEFDQVRYGDVSMAYLLAMVIVSAGVVTILRLLFIRRQHARQHSGHDIAPRFRRGPVIQMLYHVPKFLLALAVVALLIAVSDPFLTATE
jgi:hypothetical protein